MSGALLRQITKMIGIRPEAMRVALHRLRKEGWIESRRRGRSSVYFLTPFGRAQTVQASPRIYAPGPAAQDAWLAIFHPSQSTQTLNLTGAWISSNIVITSQSPDHCDAYVTQLLPDTPLPAWMADKVCATATFQLARQFSQALVQVKDDVPQPLSALQVAVLRVLVVHGWRRIALKTPILPDHVFPRDWCGAQCRASVATLLGDHPRPPLNDLEATAASEPTA